MESWISLVSFLTGKCIPSRTSRNLIEAFTAELLSNISLTYGREERSFHKVVHTAGAHSSEAVSCHSLANNSLKWFYLLQLGTSTTLCFDAIFAYTTAYISHKLEVRLLTYFSPAILRLPKGRQNLFWRFWNRSGLEAMKEICIVMMKKTRSSAKTFTWQFWCCHLHLRSTETWLLMGSQHAQTVEYTEKDCFTLRK